MVMRTVASVCALLCNLSFRRALSFSPSTIDSIFRPKWKSHIRALAAENGAVDSSAGTASRPEAIRLKDELLALASSTGRGFSASGPQRDRARKILYELGGLNPTPEPARSYYTGEAGPSSSSSGMVGPTGEGKWTLVYTDAPDITSLDSGPFAAAKLGRIGQECDPPLIKNVIEWRRPDWAASLPFSGGESSRVLQKVCTEGKADPQNPKIVQLTVVGLDIMGSPCGDGAPAGMEAGPAWLLETLGPVELRGPLSGVIPFGQFEIIYLDEDMRVIKTGQNYLAVNVRNDEEWF